MSALPRAVQKQIKEAEQAHAEAYKKPEDEKPEVADAQKPEETEQEVQPETAAEAQQGVAPVAEEEPEKKPETKSEAEPKQDATYWERRFRTLQGKYRTEGSRMNAEIRELKGELSGLREAMSKLDTQKTETPAPEQQAAAAPRIRLLKQQEIEDYGDELISVIHRGAQEAFNPEIAALKEEIKQLKGQLGGVSQTLHSTQRDSVLDILTREVPNWKTLNEDELFLSWLDQVDTFSGESRQALLDRAFGSGDAARVVAFFKGYLNESAALQPPQQEPAPSPARNTQAKLDGMVAPGKPKGSPGGAQKGEKRMWTQQQITEFYRKVQAGKYKNQPDKQVAIERDIVAAGREGRITA